MEITGHFFKYIFKGGNGYTVALFELDDGSEEDITVTGYLPEMDFDIRYKLSGDYVEHHKYGMQFNIEAFERMDLNDEENLIRYLSGAQFKGIGPKFAASLVEKFGKDVLNIIRNDPDVLDTVPKMNDKKKTAILDGLAADVNEKYYFLTSHHLSMKNILRLEKQYKENMMEVITGNPYQMVYDVDGIGFATADKFGLSIGFTYDNPCRIAALISSLLMEWCMASGDSYLEYDYFVNRIYHELNGIDVNVEDILDDLDQERVIKVQDDKVYPISQFDAESYIASYLSVFPMQPFAKADPEVIQQRISEIEEELGITYQDKQKEAIAAFFENDMMILTGGPGTGKTTIVRGMVKLCTSLFPQYNIALCAPTGRAAKRLSQLTDYEAKTIHSLLIWDKESGQFAKGEDDPLMIDLIIIDEFSMVDQWVFYNLLKAGAQFKKIVLIGDQDQLPSVGMGAVLRDLIDSNIFKVVTLEKIYRQKEGSDIISLAHDIKNDCCTDVKTDNEIRFFECGPYQIRDLILQVVDKALKKYNNEYEGFMNVQVLAPKYSGVNGIDALNVALQKEFNPPDVTKNEIQIGYRTYREGDKILQLKNQPDDDVFNGDMGILVEVIHARDDINHQNRLIVDFDGIIVEYTNETFINITHAYCVSVHKAQGSEYPIVIMPVSSEYGIMLRKRLLYTGVTRANSSLILLGNKQAFLNGLKRVNESDRHTTLKERLWYLLDTGR